jgi:hypothetical protein
MTLTTSIVIHEPLPVRRVFDHCRELIGANNDRYEFEHRTLPGRYDIFGPFNPSYRARLDQGYPALLWVDYGPDGPLRCEEDDDQPEGFIQVSFDTAYSYRVNGVSCSDLHAWLIRELGDWLKEAGATWTWHNEFTGEWFKGYDQLESLGNADKGALR